MNAKTKARLAAQYYPSLATMPAPIEADAPDDDDAGEPR